MEPKIPFQRRLFDYILSLQRKHTWIERYLRHFKISRSSAYDRIKGKTPISFDEGIQLMLHNNIPPKEIVEDWVMAATVLTTPTTPEAAPDEYLQLLSRDIQQLALSPDAYTWHQTDSIPIFWLKYSRLLAAFKLYNWFRVLRIQNGDPSPMFDDDWKNTANVATLLDQCRTMLEAYQTLPGTEIWSNNMFDTTFAQIEEVLETGECRLKWRSR